MHIAVRKRSAKPISVDLENIVIVDLSKEKPKSKKTKKPAPSASKNKIAVKSTSSETKKIVKRQPVTRKKVPKEKTPKIKTPKEKTVKAKAKVPPKPKTKRNSGIVIPEGLNIANEMKGRILRVSRENICILSRERTGDLEEGNLLENYQVSGSTGNVYIVSIGSRLKCSCRDFIYKRLHCKHLLSVLLKACRLPITSPLFTGLTPSIQELQEVFEKSIPDPSSFVSQELQSIITKKINGETVTDESINAQRRPLDTSDCPVCCEEFESEKMDEVTYCKTCGNNIHQKCFNMWKSTRGFDVTCVYCRSPWELNQKKYTKRNVNAEGYVNIGEELGLSGKRNVQSYGRVYGDLNEELSKGLDENVGKRQ